MNISIPSVAQAYLNQKRLDAEAKQLHTSANNFAKQTQQWMTLIEGFSNALKVNTFYSNCVVISDYMHTVYDFSVFIIHYIYSSGFFAGNWRRGKLGQEYRD